MYEEKPDIQETRKDVLWEKDSIDIKARDKCKTTVDALVEGVENVDLDESVSFWSDFLYTRFHPRTINIIKDYDYTNNEKPFDVLPLGQEMWKTMQFQEDYTNKVRQYLEECDSFQGFQVLLDANNAFCGLAISCLEYLQDEYERKSIFAMPVIPAHYSDYIFETVEQKCQSLIKDSVRVLNTALGFSLLAEKSSLFVPLSLGSNGWRQPGPKRNFNHVNYDVSFLFQTLFLNYLSKNFYFSTNRYTKLVQFWRRHWILLVYSTDYEQMLIC